MLSTPQSQAGAPAVTSEVVFAPSTFSAGRSDVVREEHGAATILDASRGVATFGADPPVVDGLSEVDSAADVVVVGVAMPPVSEEHPDSSRAIRARLINGP